MATIPYFEVHVGVPRAEERLVRPYLDRWAVRSFSEFRRPGLDDFSGDHDVDDGASTVITRKFNLVEDVELGLDESLNLLKLLPGARLEVEAVLFKSGGAFYDGPLFRTPNFCHEPLVRQLLDVPAFESHISFESKDGSDLDVDQLIREIFEITKDLHELAVSSDHKVGIATFFFDDKRFMQEETLRISDRLGIIRGDVHQKVTLEQILLCLARQAYPGV